MDNMYLAKKIKLFPDLFVKEYETSIWIDGKFEESILKSMKRTSQYFVFRILQEIVYMKRWQLVYT